MFSPHRITWTVEPGGLQSIGSQRVGQYWVTNAFKVTLTQSGRGSRRLELFKEQEQVFSLHIHFLKIELDFYEKLFCRITTSLWFYQLRHKRLFVVSCKFWMQVKIPYLLVIWMIMRIIFYINMTHLTRDLKILRSLWYIIILTLGEKVAWELD